VHSSHRHDPPDRETAYVTTAEAAKMLGKSPKTVSRWARAGRLPHFVTLGGHRRFPEEAIVEMAHQLDEQPKRRVSTVQS
jgi:excisionase family DNA binding protein